jgi:hypothetical protein
MLEEVLSDYPALLREFYNHPDVFKASFQYDVDNKALNNIKNFVLENMLPIHAVAKDIAQDTSAFKEAPTEVLNNIAIFLAPGDIDLFSIDAPLAGDSNHESKEDYDYEFKDAS